MPGDLCKTVQNLIRGALKEALNGSLKKRQLLGVSIFCFSKEISKNIIITPLYRSIKNKRTVILPKGFRNSIDGIEVQEKGRQPHFGIIQNKIRIRLIFFYIFIFPRRKYKK